MAHAARIVVFGEALVDQFADRALVGGAPLNVARHLAALGFAPLLITRIGRDQNGERVLEAMRRFGMATAGVQVDADLPTGVVRIDESAAGHRFAILPRQAYDQVAFDPALAALAGHARDAEAICYGTLALRSARAAATWSSLLDRVPGARFCDMNWREGQVGVATAAEAAAQADEIKVNGDELALLARHAGLAPLAVGDDVGPGRIVASIARLLAPLRAASLVVTLGEAGYAAFSRTGECLARGNATRLPSIVDTVGAGDAFTAVLIAGRLAGWPVAVRLERANAFAAAACGWRGAVPPDPDGYREWRSRWDLPA